MASIGRPQPVSTTSSWSCGFAERRSTGAGYLLQGLLLLSLLLALAVLAILLGDIDPEGDPRASRSGHSSSSRSDSRRARSAPESAGNHRFAPAHGLRRRDRLPLGVAAAVYLEEYAHDTRMTRFISTNIRNLAGVPAIVYGLLGLAVFVTLARRLGSTP